MALHHILVVGGRKLVYIEAREEHLVPTEARALAERLLMLADQAEAVD